MGKRKNVILENLHVTGYAAEGKSLARHEGKVIFMENAVPGDIVTVRLIKNKKDWAEAQVIRVTGFSPERIQPFCKHFGICGGCQWQMLPYDKQLEYKQDQVLQSLKRIGKTGIAGDQTDPGFTKNHRVQKQTGVYIFQQAVSSARRTCRSTDFSDSKRGRVSCQGYF